MENDYAESRVTPVRNSGQIYLPVDFIEYSTLRFEPGDEIRMRVLECGAIVAWPKGDMPDMPLVVPPPDLDELPWPLRTTGLTHDDIGPPDAPAGVDADTDAPHTD